MNYLLEKKSRFHLVRVLNTLLAWRSYIKSFNAEKISNLTEVIGIVEKYNYSRVSFDVFDTLIYRPCHQPVLVVKKTCRDWAKIINENSVFKVDEESIFKLRMNYIKLLSRDNKARSLDHDSDYSIRQLCEYICDLYELEKNHVTLLEQLEVKNEIDSLKIDDDVQFILRELKLRNVEIIAISDMYLLPSHIKQIFKKFKIDNLIDKIYTSGSVCKLKGTGRLFDHVVDDVGSIGLHIGDNIYADYLAPKRKNIDTRLLYNSSLYQSRKESCDNRAKFMLKNIQSELDKISLGVWDVFLIKSVYFPVISWFKLLENKCNKNNIPKLYFIAREGIVLEKIFNLCQGAGIISKHIETEILYVSRKSSDSPYFEGYLKGKLSDQDEIFIVDVGWGGSIQKNIQSVSQKPTYGFYFGVDERFVQRGEGYLFDSSDDKLALYANFFPIFESLLTPSDVGTTLGYDSNNMPIFSRPDSYLTEIPCDFYQVLNKAIILFEDVVPKLFVDNKELKTLSRTMFYQQIVNPPLPVAKFYSSIEFDFGNDNRIMVSTIYNVRKFITLVKNGGWIFGSLTLSRLSSLRILAIQLLPVLKIIRSKFG